MGSGSGNGRSVREELSRGWSGPWAVTSDVRATVQSFLAQAEYLGEISLGIALGNLAQATSISVAMLGSCALVAYAGVPRMRSPVPG